MKRTVRRRLARWLVGAELNEINRRLHELQGPIGTLRKDVGRGVGDYDERCEPKRIVALEAALLTTSRFCPCAEKE